MDELIDAVYWTRTNFFTETAIVVASECICSAVVFISKFVSKINLKWYDIYQVINEIIQLIIHLDLIKNYQPLN